MTMASGFFFGSVRETSNTQACTVCLGALRDPRLLPCLHSFCCSCIEGLALSAKPSRCPLCRCEFTCPENGAAGLARSCFQRSGGGEDRVLCGQCDESWQEAAELWCVDCQIGLCKDHGGLHRKTRGCREHTVTALATRDVGATRAMSPSRRPAERCAKHGEPLKMYCVPCRAILCCECAMRYHRNGPTSLNLSKPTSCPIRQPSPGPRLCRQLLPGPPTRSGLGFGLPPTPSQIHPSGPGDGLFQGSTLAQPPPPPMGMPHDWPLPSRPAEARVVSEQPGASLQQTPVRHSCEFIDKLGAMYSQEIAQLSSGLADKVDKMASSLASCERSLDTCASSATKARGAVTALFKAAIQALVDEEKKLQEQVDELEDIQHKRLDQQREELVAGLSEVTTALEVAARVQDSGGNVSKDWLDVAVVVHERLSNLQDQTLHPHAPLVGVAQLVQAEKSLSPFITLQEDGTLMKAVKPTTLPYATIKLAGMPSVHRSRVEVDGRALARVGQGFGWQATTTCLVGKLQELMLVAKDNENVRIPCGGADVRASLTKEDPQAQNRETREVAVTDLDDGSYRLVFTPPAIASYKLNVSIDGQTLDSFPCSVSVVPWHLGTSSHGRTFVRASSASHWPNVITAHRNGGGKGHMPLVSTTGMATGRHMWAVTGARAVGVTTTPAANLTEYVDPSSPGVWCWDGHARHVDGSRPASSSSGGSAGSISWGTRSAKHTLVLDCGKSELTLTVAEHTFGGDERTVSECITDLPRKELFAFFTLYTQGDSMSVSFA